MASDEKREAGSRTAAAPGARAGRVAPSMPSARVGLRGGVVRNPAQREEQRRRILAAASRVFARKGYEGATMDDIAAEMGGSKGILYYQFESKQDVIVATRRETSGGAALRLEAIVRRPGSVEERMELALRDLTGTNFEELSRHVILTSVTTGLDQAHVEEVRAIERGYEAALIGLLEEGIAAGVFLRANVKATAFTIIQTCLSPARWFRDGGGVSRDEVTDIVVGMVMRGLRASSRG